MKITFLICLLLTALTANAQTAETVSSLTPVSPYIGKFTKNVPRANYATTDEKIKFDVKIEPVNLPDGKKAVAILIRTSTREIAFINIGGLYTARVNFYARITSKDKKTDGFFEERSETTASVEALANDQVKPVILRKVFALPAGKYQIGVIVRDLIAGGHGVKIVKFEIS